MAGKGADSIKVAIKVRPLLRKDKEKDCLWKVSGNSIQLLDGPNEKFYFDHIFDQNASNEMVFDKMAKHIVHSAVRGFNGTIFAYGQTSSGKTYTMMGDKTVPGVAVLAIKEIFKEIQKATDRQFLLRVGYIQIYNEKIHDLLNNNVSDIKVQEDPSGTVRVNCKEEIIMSEEEVLYYFNAGNKERTVGLTNMNENSSRSHAIFRIIIESKKIDHLEEDAVIESILNLVDLAGSERADQTGASGARLKEGGHINKSLFFLGNAIKKLSENSDQKHISFRDSKLTRILQGSLGGNTLTAIICTIKPNAVDETLSTLNFAMRAKCIKNKPIKNETVSDATMMKRLEKEIKILKAKLDEERQKNESQKSIVNLEKILKQKNLNIITGQTLRNQTDKRRRTWCGMAAIEATNSSHGDYSSRIPMPSKLPIPHMPFTPLITMRPTVESENMYNRFPPNQPEVLLEDEEFVPAESCSFSSNGFKTPNGKTDAKDLFQTSITPRAPSENLEAEFLQLQEFTNLERNLGVEYEPYEALKKQLDEIIKRNNDLERDRHEMILVKDELLLTKHRLEETERCNESLRANVKRLGAIEVANSKLIEKYENEIKEFKERIKVLEIENQQAVGSEFELERLKNKAKVREKELLDYLEEKSEEIEKLQRQLVSLNEEKNQSSKQELSQNLKSVTIAASIDTQSLQTNENNALICVKCQDLQQLLDENKKIDLAFNKLNLDYKELENQLKIANTLVEQTEGKLKELEEGRVGETQRESEVTKSCTFCSELASLKESLERLKKENEKIANDNKEKTDKYMELEVSLNSANEGMRILKNQYDELETSWQNQQQQLDSMRNEYIAIQEKYQQLLKEYERSEETSVRSQEDCNRLQSKNNSIQCEIDELRRRVEEAQEALLNENRRIDHKEEEVQNLKRELDEKNDKFDELQKEYEDLSSQLLDTIQDNDILKEKYQKLEKEMEDFRNTRENGNHIASENSNNNTTPSKIDNCWEKETVALDQISILKAKIASLENEIEEKNNLLCATGKTICEMQEQMTTLQAELLEKSVYVEKCEEMRSQMEMLEKEKTEISLGFEVLQEKIKNVTMDASISFNDINNESLFERTIQSSITQQNFAYKTFISELEDLKNFLYDLGKDKDLDYLLYEDDDFEYSDQEINVQEEEFNQSNLNENENLRTPVSEAAFRKDFNQFKQSLKKSYDVRNKLKVKVQKLRQDLEQVKKKTESLVCEHQEKLREVEENYERLQEEKTTLFESELAKLQESLRVTSAQSERVLVLESELVEKEQYIEELKALHRDECESKEKAFKEDIDSLQLGYLQKLQESEDQFRENINRYNEDWARQRDSYEAIINDLKKQLPVIDDNVKEQSEFEGDKEDLLARVEQLKQKLEDYEKLSEKFIQLSAEHERLIAEHRKCSETLESWSKDKEVFDSLMKEVQEKNTLAATLESLRVQYAEAENQIKTLENSVANNLSNSVLEKQIQRLEEEKQALKNSIDSANEEKLSVLANYQSLEGSHLNELNNLSKQISELNEMVNEGKESKASLEEKCRHLESKNKLLLMEIDRLKDTENELEDLRAKMKSFDEIEMFMKKTIENLREGQKSDMNEKEELRKSLNEMQKKLATFEGLSRRADVMENENIKLLQSIETFKQELKVLGEFKIQFLGLEVEHKKLQEDYEKLVNVQNVVAASLQYDSKELVVLKEKFSEVSKENERFLVSQGETAQQLVVLKEKFSEVSKENEKLLAMQEETVQQLVVLKEKFSEVSKENEKLLASHGESASQLVVLKEKFSEVSKENEKLLASQEETAQQLFVLKEKFSEVSKENEKLLASQGETASQLVVLKEKFSEVSKENEKLLASQEEIAQQLSDLRKNLAELEKENHQLRGVRDNYTQLQQEFTKMEALAQNLKQLQEDNMQLHSYKSKFMELKDQNAQLLGFKAKVSDLQDQNDKLQKDCSQMEVTLKKYEGDIQTLNEVKEKFGSLLAKSKDREEQLEALQLENSSLLSQLESLKISKETLQNETAELQKCLALANDNALSLERRLSDICEADTDRNKLIDELQEQLSELKGQNELLRKAGETLAKQKEAVATLQMEKSQLEESTGLLNSKLEESCKANTDLQEQVASLQKLLKETANIEARFEMVKKENCTLNVQVESQKNFIRDLENQLEHKTGLADNLNALENSLKDVQNENLKLSQQKEGLENQLRILSEGMEASRSSWEEEKANLQTSLEELGARVEFLEKNNDKLKAALDKETKEHKELDGRLEDTINCLMSEKVSLEEKILNLEEILKKVGLSKEQLADSTNTSMDSSASDRHSLSPHFNKTAAVKFEERRNRRLSLHDVNRRRSYFNPSQDVSTMTEPLDESCKCSELDERLRECQKNLFIREGQVSALNMELKNHPLKSENASLTKRLQDEQEGHRNEIKRYRQKIADYAQKVTELTSLVANTNPDDSPSAEKITIMCNAETQVDFDNVLKNKYEDLKNLCRRRANVIRELEEKLSQRDNLDTKQLTAVEKGQINALKSQYESLKNEMKILQVKYDKAKQVLCLRKTQIEGLHEQMSQDSNKAPNGNAMD